MTRAIFGIEVVANVAPRRIPGLEMSGAWKAPATGRHRSAMPCGRLPTSDRALWLQRGGGSRAAYPSLLNTMCKSLRLESPGYRNCIVPRCDKNLCAIAPECRFSLSRNVLIEPRMDTDETRIRRDLQRGSPNGEFLPGNAPVASAPSVFIRGSFQLHPSGTHRSTNDSSLESALDFGVRGRMLRHAGLANAKGEGSCCASELFFASLSCCL